VDEEHIEAKYENGVLKLTIPKRRKLKNVLLS
jgi:HSP20 family molecular chaperone IbpA